MSVVPNVRQFALLLRRQTESTSQCRLYAAMLRAGVLDDHRDEEVVYDRALISSRKPHRHTVIQSHDARVRLRASGTQRHRAPGGKGDEPRYAVCVSV